MYILEFSKRNVEMIKRALFIFFLVFHYITATGQTTGKVLIISDSKAHLMIDGEDFGVIEQGKPKKEELSPGEHYIQLFHNETGTEKSSVVEITEGKQVVYRVQFALSEEEIKLGRIPVVDGHLEIPGLTSGESERGYVGYFALAEGDRLSLSFELQNNNGKCDITLFTYPDHNILYSVTGVKGLDSVQIKARNRGIYGIQLTTSAVLNRTGHLQLWRTPAKQETKSFNTEVRLVESYEVVAINENQNFYINSTSNEEFKGGKTRVILPIRVPEGTSKWYYRISASRDEAILKQAESVSSLVSELSLLIEKSGILGGILGMLTDPPGADYCDVYLFDRENSQLFLNKDRYSHYPQAGRLNFSHGNVEVDFVLPGEMYLGFENTDGWNGLHLHVEVVAIVSSTILQMIEE